MTGNSERGVTTDPDSVERADEVPAAGPTPTPAEGQRPFAEADGIDATWAHRDARQGFESAGVRARGDGHRLVGRTHAVEDGVSWTVNYQIDVDQQWRTVRAEVSEVVAGRENRCVVESDRGGRWTIDGVAAPQVDGCIDIDLEASVLTNTIFLHRAQPSTTDSHDAPAAFLRVAPLRLERVEQTYRRTTPAGRPDEITFAYASPAFGTDIELRFDGHGLVIDYPGLAVRTS